MSEKNNSLRQSLLEKVVFPVVSAVLSSIVIGIVLSVLIDGKMERWKTVSTLQINREHEARIEMYDAYAAASQRLYNLYWQTGATRQETYDAIGKFGAVYSSHSAYLPEELEQTYKFLDFELIIGSRLCAKDLGGELSADDTQRYSKAMNTLSEVDSLLREFMRDWHNGNTKNADTNLHGFYAKYVKTGLAEADAYSTKVLNDEQGELSEPSVGPATKH